MSTISRAVEAAIKESGLSQEKVALAVGVSQSEVSRWVNGVHDPKDADLRRLAAALGRPITVTYGGKAKEPPEPKWLRGLVREIRMNRAVIQAAFAGTDPAFVRRVLDRLATLEEPPTQPDDEVLAVSDEAT